MTDTIVYGDCPHCRKQIQIVLAGQGKPAQSPVQNGLLAELKPFVMKDWITIDQTRNPLIVRMRKYDVDTWQAINKIIESHGGKWRGTKQGIPKDQVRWEVPA